jgi:uncharacterized OB-fold protein
MSDHQIAQPLSQPFVDGLKQHRIQIQRCKHCHAVLTLARYACTECGSDSLEWFTSAGTGTVYARTIVSRAPSDLYRPLAPYTLVIVELDEGSRLMGHAKPGVEIGQRVKTGFFEHAGMTLIRFEPD